MRKIESFQFLRALCAICVFLNHVPFLHNTVNGQAGVALFMMIGGFFAMKSSETRKDNIFIKKIIKIVPLYWSLTLLLFIAAKFVPQLLNHTDPTITNLIKSLFFIPFEVPGAGHKPIINVGWYLNIDIMFTLIFSIATKISHKKRGTITAIIILLLFIIGQNLQIENYIINVYTKFYIIYYFLGIIMYYIFKKYFLNIKELSKIHQLCIAILFTIYMFVFKYNYISLIYACIIFIYILMINKTTINKFVISIGNNSFSIYLLHYFILAMSSRLIYSLESINILSVTFTILCFIITYFISLIVTKYTNITTKKLYRLLKITN